VNREEILRRTGRVKTPEETGMNFLWQLVFNSTLFVVAFFGILWLVFVWSFGGIAPVERSGIETIKLYLEGKEYYTEKFPDTYDEIEIISYSVRKDYWATLVGGCANFKCNSMNRQYTVTLTYRADGAEKRGVFQLISHRSVGYWEVVAK
jgi:hypothetical protein